MLKALGGIAVSLFLFQLSEPSKKARPLGMNISRLGSHQYSFEIHQCMNEIHLPFAMRHDTQSGASMSMTRAYARAKAHH